MRPIIRPLTAAVLLAATAPLAGAAVAVAAPAQVDRVVVFNAAAYDTCSGQFVNLAGTFGLVTKQQADGSIIQLATIHATGTGERSGEYLFNDTQRVQVTGDNVDLVDHNVLVNQGSAPNQIARVHIDPAGVVTLQIECAG